jgi:hypothetical protein
LPAQVCGTHWVNIETMWWPSGARVLSNTEGMQTSANGTAEGRPAAASWKAPSMSSSDSASTMVPPWISGSKAGRQVNWGSRSTARLTLTVPLRVFQRSMSATKSPGSSARSTCSRKVIRGWVAATTTSVASSSPPSRTTPVTRPSLVVMRRTGAEVRISAPNERAAPAMASLTPPMPPSANPQLPSLPSPTTRSTPPTGRRC